MPARYLLDTNILIYIRQRRPPSVLERFARLTPGDACLSTITYGELLYGVTKSRERTRAETTLKALIELLPVLPLPVDAGAAYGDIRAALEAKGQKIGNNDLWIAAHARAEGLTLVTNNTREFDRVAGLKVENWV